MEIVQGIENTIARIETYPAASQGWERRKLAAILAYQWELETCKFMDDERIQFKVSRSTGKMRYVQKEGEILFTLVPTTGLLTPTYKGGLTLQNEGIGERFSVTVDDDAAEFVAIGKSALAKFVSRASDQLLAGEEVLIVDKDNTLLGTGRALLTGPEMLAFDRGVAVVPRHSRK